MGYSTQKDRNHNALVSFLQKNNYQLKKELESKNETIGQLEKRIFQLEAGIK